jgi:hypothetical protein
MALASVADFGNTAFKALLMGCIGFVSRMYLIMYMLESVLMSS